MTTTAQHPTASSAINTAITTASGVEIPASLLNSTDYAVDIDIFRGPLDLLLYLIRKEEVDINNIPIARITQQYLTYLNVITALNLEAAGEFIYMAATLINIKARLLLPREELALDEPDPRAELVAALLEYRRYKDASEELRDMREREETVFVPERDVTVFEKQAEVFIPANTMYQLIGALKDVLTRAKEVVTEHVTSHEPVHIEDRVARIYAVLRKQDSATFSDLFSDVRTKIVAVVTFIAILEMLKGRRIRTEQSTTFDEMHIYRGDNFDDPSELIVDEWDTSVPTPSTDKTIENEANEAALTVVNT